VAFHILVPLLPVAAAHLVKGAPPHRRGPAGPSARAPGLFAALLGLVLSQGACAAGGGAPAVSAPAGEGSLVGNPAPDFSVAPVAGPRAPLSLKHLHGKVVLVDFWGTFCTPCKSSFPKLQALNAKYAGSGLEVIGISEDEAEDKGKIPAFASTYGARFAIGWDEDRSISQRYQPETMPSSFLIDRKGIVRFTHVGFRSGDEVQIEKEIQDLLAR
jgi:cytochrome c biogenesis protein CcmG/thiol:disulfide interchange protein DsbE